MKRRVMTIIIGIIVIVVLVLVGWYVMFVHFGKGPAFPFLPTASAEEYLVPVDDVSEKESLMALTDSEETAREIADQYGITFVFFENGVAIFDTDEDTAQVIERGEKNGYPPLYVNQKRELYDAQISEVNPTIIGEYYEMEDNK